ncbi:MAG TPA: putative sulfate exporter family transporter [Candidatus Bathyarchaeia archaeon]|nr:putative sulfate exporter family transporter [Candidatus Bathyarchaeia archaeon]
MGFVDKIFRKRNENSRSNIEVRTPQPQNNTADSLNANNDATRYVEGSTRINWSSLYKKEDWWAVWIGLTIFALSLPSYAGFYTLGWVPVAKPWLYISHALTTKLFNPWVGLIASFVFLALLLIPVTRFNGVKSKDWFKGFFVIFFAAWGIWILSNYAPVVKAIGSAEVGYIIALLVGIVVTNVMRIPSWLKDSARGELFIKTAIVLLGAKILFTTFVTSTPSILLAVFLSFPVVWIIAFLISRRMGLDRNFAATLSSGVGVCGVSASMATASAIEAPAIYSTAISSIIVIFSAVEIILMPFVGAYFFPTHTTAAGVWMGLSVKTDGAAAASASIVDGLLKAKGSALNSAVITKVMIDIWIGVISFVLAIVWTYRVRKQLQTKVTPRVLWYRFPKFILGYLVTSMILSAIAFTYPSVAAGVKAVAPVVTYGTDPIRVMFFSFTFLAIGLNTRFSKFKEIGLKTPFMVYAISLTIAIVWGGVISYFLFGR